MTKEQSMKKKLKLKDLEVNSFVTEAGVKGGNYATCKCSLPTTNICYILCERETRPINNCI